MNDELRKCIELGDFFEFMPASSGKHSQLELPRTILKHPISETITFFGGTFDPFHEGHRACLDLCPEKNILIIPDRNPLKDLNLNADRVYTNFLELAELLKDTKYSLYPGFLGLKAHNATSSWLPKVKINEKNFLMGDDSFMNLLNWTAPEELLSALTKIYVVPRNFKSTDYLSQEKKLKTINPNLTIIYLNDHQYRDKSSSEIRQKKSHS